MYVYIQNSTLTKIHVDRLTAKKNENDRRGIEKNERKKKFKIIICDVHFYMIQSLHYWSATDFLSFSFMYIALRGENKWKNKNNKKSNYYKSLLFLGKKKD